MRKYFAAAVSVLFLASAVISPAAAQDKQAKKPAKTEQTAPAKTNQQKTTKKETAKSKSHSKEAKKDASCGETKCSHSCENE